MHINEFINQYQVIDRLGEGGMGVVYLAEDTRLQRNVALKFVTRTSLNSSDEIARFHREARAAARLNHPNICTVYELGEADDKTFIAMEYVEGVTLKECMQQGPIEIGDIKAWLKQIAEGLRTAHEAGVIHRDIKPANLMITDRGLIKIMDFGIAKLTESETELTQANSTMGTIAYMSPEQARGESIDQQSDIWSLGVILYELSTGKRPFSGAFREAIMYAMMHEEPPAPSEINPDVPDDLEHIITKCLQRDRSERYPSLEELLNDLAGHTAADVKPSRIVESKGTSGEIQTIMSNKATDVQEVTLLGSKKRRLVTMGIVGVLVLLALFPGIRSQLVGSEDAVTQLPSIMHLAVLPFDTVGSPSEEDRAFSNGLAHLVATNLMRMKHDKEEMWIIPVREVLSRGVTSTSEAKEAFGVNLAVSGTIINITGAIQITLDVTDARTLRVIDTDVIDVPDMDPAQIQVMLMARLSEMLELNAANETMLLAGITDDPEAYKLYVQAEGFIQQYDVLSNVDEAISLYEQAIEQDSTYALAYAGAGFAYARKYFFTKEVKWMERASSVSEKAMGLNNELAEVWITAGRLQYDSRNYEESVRALTRAIELDSTSYEAHRRLGTVYWRLGENEKSEALLKKAIALQPKYWDGYNMLGILYRNSGATTEAISLFEKVLELSPDNFFVYGSLATIYLDQGDTTRAVQTFLKSPPYAPTYMRLAWISRQQNAYEDAVEYYKKAIALTEKDHRIWFALGSVYQVQGDTLQAQDSWQQVMAIIEEKLESLTQVDPAIFYSAVRATTLLNRADEAQKYIEQYLTAAYGPTSLLNVATSYVNLNDRQRALEHLELALKEGLSPEEVENASWYADVVDDSSFQALVERYR